MTGPKTPSKAPLLALAIARPHVPGGWVRGMTAPVLPPVAKELATLSKAMNPWAQGLLLDLAAGYVEEVPAGEDLAATSLDHRSCATTPDAKPASRSDQVRWLADRAKEIYEALEAAHALGGDVQAEELLDCSARADDLARDLDLLVGDPR